MALKRIEVKGLFGDLHHTIELNQDDHITILHGPNGVGKTTILHIVDAFFRLRFSTLRRIPFDTIDLGLTSKDRLVIHRTTEGPGDLPRLRFTPYRGRRRLGDEFVAVPVIPENFPVGAIDDFIPWLSRTGPREWRDLQTGRRLELTEVFDLYGDELPMAGQRVATPAWLSDFADAPVHIIETQRLLAPPSAEPTHSFRARHDNTGQTSTVRLLADQLKARIGGELATYAERSQELDRSFPSRLLEESRSSKAASDAAIREKYDAQGRDRSRLVAAGLLDTGEELVLRGDLSETERKVLWTYLGDVDKKLRVLFPIAEKIETFREILNGKYLAKQITVSRNAGFQVVTDRGDTLDPDVLSSGEQHELVLAYRLLFDVAPGSLILIDEPELSLHVSWQRMFLPDLERISKTAQLDFLIATHSPTIIGDRWDLTQPLNAAESADLA